MSKFKNVRDLMTREVVTFDENDELRLADDLMRLGRIRHLPVVDGDGELVGIVSQRDLFHSALLRALGFGSVAKDRIVKGMRIKEVMHRAVETIGPDELLSDAAERMVHKKIGCLPVLEDGRLIGLLTEGDFVSAFLERSR